MSFGGTLAIATRRAQREVRPRWAGESGVKPQPTSRPVITATIASLTPRQRQMAPMLAEELTVRQIAAKMNIAHETAKVSASALYKRVGVGSRLQFANWYREQRGFRGIESSVYLPRYLNVIHDYIVQGFGNKQIAAQLSVCEGTVKRYVHLIFELTGCQSRVNLALFRFNRQLEDRLLTPIPHAPGATGTPVRFFE